MCAIWALTARRPCVSGRPQAAARARLSARCMRHVPSRSSSHVSAIACRTSGPWYAILWVSSTSLRPQWLLGRCSPRPGRSRTVRRGSMSVRCPRRADSTHSGPGGPQDQPLTAEQPPAYHRAPVGQATSRGNPTVNTTVSPVVPIRSITRTCCFCSMPISPVLSTGNRLLPPLFRVADFPLFLPLLATEAVVLPPPVAGAGGPYTTSCLVVCSSSLFP